MHGTPPDGPGTSSSTFQYLGTIWNSAVSEQSNQTSTTGASPATNAENSAKDSASNESSYHVKWIKWRGEPTPILMQNKNGPCPLIAIVNAIILRGSATIPEHTTIMEVSELLELVEKSISIPESACQSEETWLNYERNRQDVSALLPSLSRGLDVNVKFTGINDFEYNAACMVFDVLQVPLYHGWIIDPDLAQVLGMVGNCSYNQLIDKIIDKKHSPNPDERAEAVLVENFLLFTATQLTHYGLEQLKANIPEDQLSVLFRNNHFITLYKNDQKLFQLVTDEGFRHERSIVWETLTNVKGDEQFLDSDFVPYVPRIDYKSREANDDGPPPRPPKPKRSPSHRCENTASFQDEPSD